MRASSMPRLDGKRYRFEVKRILLEHTRKRLCSKDLELAILLRRSQLVEREPRQSRRILCGGGQ